MRGPTFATNRSRRVARYSTTSAFAARAGRAGRPGPGIAPTRRGWHRIRRHRRRRPAERQPHCRPRLSRPVTPKFSAYSFGHPGPAVDLTSEIAPLPSPGGPDEDRGSRPAPSNRGGPSGQGALTRRRRPARGYGPRHLLGGSGLCADGHHRHPGRRGRLQDAGGDHRRIPADVLRRVRLPRIQQGRTGLRDIVHLDHQGLRALHRLARRMGGRAGDRHRAVQPRRRRGPVLLPVHR